MNATEFSLDEEKSLSFPNCNNSFTQKNNLMHLFKTAIIASDTHNNLVHVNKMPAGENMRRFNAPSIEEVAIFTVGNQFQSR